MIGTLRMRIVGKDATRILDNGFRVNRGRDRTTHKELRLNCVDDVFIQINHAVLDDGRVGKVINFGTRSSHTGKGIARAAGIGRRTRRVELGTKSFRRFFTARHVRHAGIVRNVSHLFNEFVRLRVVSSVTRSGCFGTAIENVLNAQINIVALTQTSNLDAIGETGQGSVRPAAAAVLGNVLIERMGQVAHAIDVAPVKVVRQVVGAEVRVGKRRSVVVQDGVFADLES
jgi:hypothetical protein